MKKSLLILAIFALGLVGTANAAPVTLVEQGSTWDYTTLGFDLWPSMTANYGDFDWAGASYNTGDAAFGNAGAYTTYWAANTDLALKQSFEVDGAATGSLLLNVASDNGFIIFLNGVEVANENAGGWTSYWEYNLNISSSSLVSGTNVVSVFAEDHGGGTYFDMKLSGDVEAVPEPATMLLSLIGFAGLAFYRKKNKKA